MKTLMMKLMSMVVLAAPLAAGAAESCAEGYALRGLFVDGGSRTTYFHDAVIELAKADDGGAVVAFRKSARRYAIPASEAGFLAAARASFTNGMPVHVAVDEPAAIAVPTPDDSGPLPVLVWVDRVRQHPSCTRGE